MIELESAFGLNRGRFQKSAFILTPELEARLPLDLRLTAIGRLRTDAADRLEPGDPSQPEVGPFSRRGGLGDHADLELREFYVDASVGRTYLRLGKQQIVWGKTDGLKLLDVINPQDFQEFVLDDFDDSRIPLWSLNAEIPIGGIEAQFIWVPDRTYHDLPAPGAAFAFTSPRFVPSPPAGIDVAFRPTERPDRFFADSDVGVRLSTFWKGWDLTANYLYHYYDIPVFDQAVIVPGAGAPFVEVTPRYKRSHLMGGSFSNAFGSLTVRGEMAFSTDRHLLANRPAQHDGYAVANVFEYALGFDWFGMSDTFISAQVFQNWVTQNKDGLIRDRLETSTTLLVQRDFMNERLRAEVLGVQSVTDGDGFVQTELSYEVRSNVKVRTGYDVFYGARKGLAGQFGRQDRVSVGLEIGL